jgi:A/G-specific adenine glycosylase
LSTTTFAARVIAWQRRHGRHDLPWQGTRDAYRIWLSEVMLQQTQVATVLDYYARFLLRFPDVATLAGAPLDDVLALWSGLGYYSRARHLHRCAQVVMVEHGGAFPRSAAALAELPGIGRSTAAAIAAFAFGERVAILDGNVKRVLARALGFDADLAEPRHVNALWDQAGALLPARSGIESYTQGLMDLGAGVCLARAPACCRCPLHAICVAAASGEPTRWPVRTRRLERGRRANVWLWLRWRDRHWLLRRPPQGVWAGLWSLPEFGDDAALDADSAHWPGTVQALPSFKHALTHFDWTLAPRIWTLPARIAAARADAVTARWPDGRWCTLDQALALALPAPLRRLLLGNA